MSAATTMRVVVFHATGHQGASVCRTLVNDKECTFDVVGITRNVNSPIAQELAKCGVTMCPGTMDDPASYEPALKGAHGMFLMGDFWAYYDGVDAEKAKQTEIAHCKTAIDCAKRMGIKHIVFSTMESVGQVPHFDSKAEITAYIAKLGLPATQLYKSFYMNYLLGVNYMVKGNSTVLRIPLPDDTVIPAMAVEQTGMWVRAALCNPDVWIGKDMYACSELLTVGGIAKTFTDVLGCTFDTQHRTRDEFMNDKTIDPEIFKTYMVYMRGMLKRDPAMSKKIVPDQWDLAAWVKHSETLLRKKFDC